MSLDKWFQNGTLQREIDIYNRLASNFSKIFFFTYGDEEEYKYYKYLEKNIQIIPNTKKTNDLLYSFIIPILYRKILSKCELFKTNQMRGSWTAYLSSLRKNSFILRSGYTWSLFLERETKKRIFLLKIVQFIEGLMYKCCNLAFVSSKQDLSYIVRKYSINPNKIRVINNYVNTDHFKPIPMKKFVDRLLFVGRLEKQKNLLNLIDGLTNTSLSLDIIGEGSLKAILEEKAKKSKVKINFLGRVPSTELPKLMNKYKIFILPSYYEGMPKVLLEAMSCGLACVATNVPGSNEIIENRKNGILIDTCNSEDIKRSILQLIGNEVLQMKLGRNASKFIKKNYSLGFVLRKELKNYEFLLNKQI